jgi:hypothetical protein
MMVSGNRSDLVRRRRVLSFFGLAQPYRGTNRSIWIVATDLFCARRLRPSGGARLMQGFPASEGPKPALFIATGNRPAASRGLPFGGARDRRDHPANPEGKEYFP